MALKIAVTGKGGVGKSTVAATLARLWAREGRAVLAIDCDPDSNLGSALGLPAEVRSRIRTIATERQLVEERTGAKAREFGQIFRLNPDVNGIAEEYAVRHAGVALLTLGGAERAGAGCACPESVLLKSLVRHLVLRPSDVVILDMEAGIEHSGRGSAMGVDAMAAVVEPGERSVETALRIRDMAASLGIRRFTAVLNKSVEPEAERAWIEPRLGPLAGVIPYDLRIARSDRLGMSVIDLGYDDLVDPFRSVAQNLAGFAHA